MNEDQSKKAARLFVTVIVYGTIVFVWLFALALIYETWLRPALGW